MPIWWPRHDDSSSRWTVGTIELHEIEGDLEVLVDGRSLLVWRWSRDGRIVGRTEAGEALLHRRLWPLLLR